MVFNEGISLAYLEEDNLQRAYFRIRPLLMESGPLAPEALAAIPDDGYLRIVPDKNEQHTFKDRMRALQPLCVLDMRGFPADSNKIRTNKNYAPDRGENNRYIVYSDAVRPIPEGLVYEVAAPGEKGATAKTCLRGERGVTAPDGAAADPARVFRVTLPDGGEREFYWPAPAQKDETSPSDESLDIGKPLHILDESQDFEQQLGSIAQPLPESANLLAPRPARMLRAAPVARRELAGTPLYRAAPAAARRAHAHNPLSEVVERELRAAKHDAPSAQLSSPAAMKPVDNPVEDFRRALAAAWALPEAQGQVVDALLGTGGLPRALRVALHEESAGDLVTGAMRSQLQELEAERLALIMQLENARKNADDYRRSLAGELAGEAEERLAALKQAQAQAEAALSAARGELARVRDDRDAFLLECAPEFGLLHLSPPCGEGGDLSALAARVQAALAAAGFDAGKDDAMHLLLLVTLFPCVRVEAGDRESAALAARALLDALGAQSVLLGAGERLAVHAGGEGICAAVTERARRLPEGVRQLTLSGDAPCARLRAVEGEWPSPRPAQKGPAVSLDCLKREAARYPCELPAQARELLQALRDVLRENGVALPLPAAAQINEYLACAPALLPGGMAAALDRAVCAWLLPLARDEKTRKALAPMLKGLPLAAGLLSESDAPC